MQNTVTELPASHFTAGQVHQLVREAGHLIFQLGDHRVRIMRGSFTRDFDATPDGVFRAAPIRSWLGG